MSLLSKDELLNNDNKNGYLVIFSMNNNPAYLKSNFFYQCNDLNNKILNNEADVIDFNLINVNEHLYNPFLFKNNKLNEILQEQEILELKQNFLRLINNYIEYYENNNNKNNNLLNNIIKKINL
ncbi:hypothetical protein J6P11_05235 [bacterium]|nr:hypothetical protein [bacterium]